MSSAPKPGEESQDAWMERCMMEIINAGAANADAAVEMCAATWGEASKKGNRPATEKFVRKNVKLW